MGATTAIVVTLVIYKVALVVVGVLAQRSVHDVTDYFLGGRRMGAWVASLSASASSSSAWSLLGVSGAAYTWGLGSLWLFPACVGGFVLNWYVLAPGLRRLAKAERSVTVTDVVAGPVGVAGSMLIRRVATAIVLLSLMTYVASQFQGAGKTFAETFSWSMERSVLVGSAIVVLYTMLGGFWAVSVTDMIQGVVMAMAAIALPVAALAQVGGPAGLLDALPGVDAAGFADPFRNLAAPAAAGFTLGVLGIGLGYPGQPHVVNRFMAMRDDRSIVVGRRIAIGWAAVIYAGMIVLGLCARVLFPEVADNEVAFVVALRELFPPVVAGIMLAAVLSAIMSTADSQLLVAASSVTHDLDPRRDTADAASPSAAALGRSRFTVLALSAAAVVAAIYTDSSIFDKVLFAWSAMGAAFGPVLLVRVLQGPIAWRHRLAAVITGFAGSVLAYFLPFASGTAWERVAPFVLAFAIAWAGTRPGRRS